jgi:hypothetical protein
MRARWTAVVAAMVAVVALAAWGLARPGGRRVADGARSSGALSQSPSPAASPTQPVAGPFGVSGPPGRGWRLKFASHFGGHELDPRIWDTCYPWFTSSSGCTNFGNREYQWYTPSQVHVSDGELRLSAQRERTSGLTSSGASKVYGCRSGMVTTYPGFRFTYGYVQVVARIPEGPGLWPALWLAAANLRWPPEIDMLEHWSRNRQSGLFYHPVNAPQDFHHVRIANLGTRWHTFAVLWGPARITWYIDGYKVFTVDREVPHQPMYFIANVAEFRAPHVKRCSGTMAIRSVKIWQR